MGCFSFICKKSGEPVLSSSFSGDAVHLFLLKNGQVIEEMFGNYNSYGSVFSDQDGTDSFEWKMDWSDVCDLIFSDNDGDGIAAILDEYYDDIPPTEQSDDDPNQGWGTHSNLMGSISKNIGKVVETPYHTPF